RRHTRSKRDWSSDVCSSDLKKKYILLVIRCAFKGLQMTMIGYTKLTNWKKETIMMKAPVYRGNSGSPVINYAGQVIGVVFATLEHTEHGKVGLFVPIDYLFEKVNVDSLID